MSNRSRALSLVLGVAVGGVVVHFAGQRASQPAEHAGITTLAPPAEAAQHRPRARETTDLTPEQEREMIYGAFQAKLDAHASAPRRDGWSSEAEKSFRLDFEEVCAGDGRCSFTSADCRYETCVVNVSFPSVTDAARGMGPLAHKAYRVNCAVEVVLPDDVPAEGAVEAAYYLDCSKFLRGEIDQQGQPIARADP